MQDPGSYADVRDNLGDDDTCGSCFTDGNQRKL